MKRELLFIAYLLTLLLNAESTSITSSSLLSHSSSSSVGSPTLSALIGSFRKGLSSKDLGSKSKVTLAGARLHNRYMDSFQKHINYHRLIHSAALKVEEEANKFSAEFLNLELHSNRNKDPIKPELHNSESNKNLNNTLPSFNSTNDLVEDNSHNSAILRPEQSNLTATSILDLFERFVETVN